VKLVVQVLQIILVLVEVGQCVCEAGDACGIEGYFDFVPALRNFENDTTYLGIKVVFDLVVTPKNVR
jgi:hypothetical protein